MEKRLRIAVTLLAILFVILTITCANLLMWSHEYRGQINERFQEDFNELCSGLFSRENSDEKLAVLRGKAESCGDLFMLSCLLYTSCRICSRHCSCKDIWTDSFLVQTLQRLNRSIWRMGHCVHQTACLLYTSRCV